MHRDFGNRAWSLKQDGSCLSQQKKLVQSLLFMLPCLPYPIPPACPDAAKWREALSCLHTEPKRICGEYLHRVWSPNCKCLDERMPKWFKPRRVMQSGVINIKRKERAQRPGNQKFQSASAVRGKYFRREPRGAAPRFLCSFCCFLSLTQSFR